MYQGVTVLASLLAILGTPLLCPSGLISCCEPVDACSAAVAACDADCTDIKPGGDCECPCKSPTPGSECPTCIVTCAPLTMLDAGPNRPCLEPTCLTIFPPVDGLASIASLLVGSMNDPILNGSPPGGAVSGSLPLLI